MKMWGMTCTLSQLIGCRENRLIAFTFWMVQAFDVHWMPIELAQLIVCMAMESAYHKVEVEFTNFHSQAAVVFRGCKGTPDIITTSSIWTICREKLINYHQWILCTDSWLASRMDHENKHTALHSWSYHRPTGWIDGNILQWRFQTPGKLQKSSFIYQLLHYTTCQCNWTGSECWHQILQSPSCHHIQ